jgi:hypothetical protein
MLKDRTSSSTPCHKLDVVSVDQLVLLDDLCFEFLRDDVQEHGSEHSWARHEFGPVSVQQLLPGVHVRRNLRDLCASLILTQDLNASVLNHVSCATIIFKESTPHLKSVSLLAFSTAQLFPLAVLGGRKIINHQLFKLDCEIGRILAVWSQPISAKSAHGQILFSLGDPLQCVPPADMYLCHVVDKVTAPVDEICRVA